MLVYSSFRMHALSAQQRAQFQPPLEEYSKVPKMQCTYVFVRVCVCIYTETSPKVLSVNLDFPYAML
jgi:hypothetical protein